MLPLFARSRILSSQVLILIAAGCLPATMAEARTRPHYGGTVHVAVESDPLQAPNGAALRLVLDGLTRPGDNEESGVRPHLSIRWSRENNDHRWQFWLRSGVTFHNGSPLNGVAVVNSLNGSCRMNVCPWSGLHVVGQSVVFTGESAMPNLPELLARPEFLIRQVPSQASSETSPSDSQAAISLIGTGPFRVMAATPATLRLQANEDCWQGRPFADVVEISIRHASPDRARRDQWGELSLGKTDLIEIQPSDIRAARLQQLRVIQTPAVTLLALEVNNPNLAPQLRAAIALSVDRAALQQVIFQKQAEITASLLPASLSGYSFLFPQERDLPGALARRGGMTPPPLTLAADNSAPMQLAAQRLALNLHDAGFAVRVVPLLTGINARQRADLVLRSLPVAGGTPASTLEWMLHSLGLDTAVAATEPVVAFKAERDFLEQNTVIPLLFLPRAWAASSRLRDLHLDADGLANLANASLAAAAPTASAEERAP